MHLVYLTVLTTLFAPLEGLSVGSRLPRWVVPLRYRLDIVTRINQPYQPFGGTVLIDLRSERPTKKLVLNSRDLEIRKQKGVSLMAKGGRSVGVSHINLSTQLSRLTVYLKSTLTVNITYTLAWSAKIARKLEIYCQAHTTTHTHTSHTHSQTHALTQR